MKNHIIPFLTVLFFCVAICPEEICAVENNILITVAYINEPQINESFPKTTNVMICFDKKKLAQEALLFWTDENGETADIVNYGMWNLIIALWVPKEVMLDISSLDTLKIRMPSFINTKHVALVYDDETNILYISGAFFKIQRTHHENRMVNVNYLDELEYNIENKSKLTTNDVGDIVEAGENIIIDEFSDTDDGIIPMPLAGIHSHQEEMEKYGFFLEEFVNLIKNNIEPRAVHLLSTNFDAYRKAIEKGHIGDKIGMEVLDEGNNGVLSVYAHLYEITDMYDSETYNLISSEIQLKHKLVVNIHYFANYNEQENEWEMDTSRREILDNTIIHEMMHAFMTEYDFESMLASEYAEDIVFLEEHKLFDRTVPSWFKEGAAEVVTDVYSYRNNGYKSFFYDDYEERYTSLKILDAKLNEKNSIWLYDSYDDNNVFARYGMGALATYYLAALSQDINIVDTKQFKHEDFLEGLNYIIEELHEGIPFIDIINKIENSNYTNVQEFENRFLTDNKSVMFAVNFLNYLETSGSRGSILYAFEGQNQDDCSITEQLNASVFEIIDSKEMEYSTITLDEPHVIEGISPKDDDNTYNENNKSLLSEDTGYSDVTIMNIMTTANDTHDQICRQDNELFLMENSKITENNLIICEQYESEDNKQNEFLDIDRFQGQTDNENDDCRIGSGNEISNYEEVHDIIETSVSDNNNRDKAIKTEFKNEYYLFSLGDRSSEVEEAIESFKNGKDEERNILNIERNNNLDIEELSEQVDFEYTDNEKNIDDEVVDSREKTDNKEMIIKDSQGISNIIIEKENGNEIKENSKFDLTAYIEENEALLTGEIDILYNDVFEESGDVDSFSMQDIVNNKESQIECTISAVDIETLTDDMVSVEKDDFKLYEDMNEEIEGDLQLNTEFCNVTTF